MSHAIKAAPIEKISIAAADASLAIFISGLLSSETQSSVCSIAEFIVSKAKPTEISIKSTIQSLLGIEKIKPNTTANVLSVRWIM